MGGTTFVITASVNDINGMKNGIIARYQITISWLLQHCYEMVKAIKSKNQGTK
jgi:hypothetical protein